MYDPSNPYASPMSERMEPAAAQWLGTPTPSLQKVALGLGLVYASVLVIVSAIVGGAVAGGIIGAANPNRVEQAIAEHRTLILGIFLVGLAGRVLGTIGSFFCLATPPETKAQAQISLSVTTMVAAIALQVGIIFDLVSEQLEPVQLVLMVVSWLTFGLFLRRMSEFVGRIDLVDRSKTVLGWMIGVIAIFAGIYVLPRLAANNPGGINGLVAIVRILSLVLLVCGLIMVAKFASLVRDIRKAILSGGRT